WPGPQHHQPHVHVLPRLRLPLTRNRLAPRRGLRHPTPMPGTHEFAAARELLFRHRDDWDAAYRQFRWPALDRFHWALDWFDVLARGNGRRAGWVVDDAGRDDHITYAELADRTSRLANHLRGLGVARGDRVIGMLPNMLQLWETVIACAKLGAVVIPSTTQLTP